MIPGWALWKSTVFPQQLWRVCQCKSLEYEVKHIKEYQPSHHSYSFIICHHVIIINQYKSYQSQFSTQLCQWGLKLYETSRRGWASRRGFPRAVHRNFSPRVRQTLRERKPPSQRRPCIWVHQDECNQNMLRYLIDLNTIHNTNIYIYEMLIYNWRYAAVFYVHEI